MPDPVVVLCVQYCVARAAKCSASPASSSLTCRNMQEQRPHAANVHKYELHERQQFELDATDELHWQALQVLTDVHTI